MTTLNYGGGGGPLTTRPKAHYSLPSLIAIACAVGSFFVGSGTATLLLAIAAAIFGVIGVIVALLPHVRGGLISFLSIGLGLIGIIVAIVRFVSSSPQPPTYGV